MDTNTREYIYLTARVFVKSVAMLNSGQRELNDYKAINERLVADLKTSYRKALLQDFGADAVTEFDAKVEKIKREDGIA